MTETISRLEELQGKKDLTPQESAELFQLVINTPVTPEEQAESQREKEVRMVSPLQPDAKRKTATRLVTFLNIDKQ